MVRIVGILCGSAISVSFLIIALGIPEFTPEPDPVIESEQIPESPTTIESAVEVIAEPAVEAIREPVIDAVVEPAAEMAVENQAPPQAPAEHWYAFWSPFRSELAANGFVSQLQRTTGMDYRVVRLKPGVYEVAFAYEVENDIETKLAAISAATGLEMPDG
jgi:hypothetical protein